MISVCSFIDFCIYLYFLPSLFLAISVVSALVSGWGETEAGPCGAWKGWEAGRSPLSFPSERVFLAGGSLLVSRQQGRPEGHGGPGGAGTMKLFFLPFLSFFSGALCC